MLFWHPLYTSCGLRVLPTNSLIGIIYIFLFAYRGEKKGIQVWHDSGLVMRHLFNLHIGKICIRQNCPAKNNSDFLFCCPTLGSYWSIVFPLSFLETNFKLRKKKDVHECRKTMRLELTTPSTSILKQNGMDLWLVGAWNPPSKVKNRNGFCFGQSNDFLICQYRLPRNLTA